MSCKNDMDTTSNVTIHYFFPQLLVSHSSVKRLKKYCMLHKPNKVKNVKMQCTIQIAHSIRKCSTNYFG